MSARNGGAVLMCPPDYYTVRDVKNPFMTGAEPVDSELAAAQWEALRRAFAEAGLETLRIEPVEDLEDMVFAANQVFVAPGDPEPFVIPSRMRHPSRRREVPYYVEWFRTRGFDVRELDLGDEYLEGHGDLIPHPSRALIWGGFGFRSSRGGVERFAAAMAERGVALEPLELIDPTFYHLDTCFATLGSDAALLFPDAFAPESLERLRRAWPRLYEISRAEALRFTCNAVAVNGRFIASHVPEALAAALETEGLEPLVVDLSEFEKAGGSAFCLKSFVA